MAGGLDAGAAPHLAGVNLQADRDQDGQQGDGGRQDDGGRC
jgi:hypothetical protein